MNWFKRKANVTPMVVQPPAQSRIEVELHKSASQEAAEKAKETNRHLNDLLVANGFTLKIYIAAGGHQPKRVGKK
jgi:hypothetical protein